MVSIGRDPTRDGALVTRSVSVYIGEWRLDTGTQRLYGRGRSCSLDPKSMGVLLHLLEAAPDYVSTRALLERSWPRVIVGDNALQQVVARLRRALGDDARNPAYIETLPRRGYRVMVPVESTAPTSTPRSASSREPTGDAVVLAVMPFQDRSTEAADSYLAEGLSLEIAARLSKLRSVRVISWNAVQASIARGVTRESVAADLRADKCVDGTVGVVHGRIRVTVQLSDAKTGLLRWSDTFDRDADDLLDLHRELALAIVSVLDLQLASIEHEAIRQQGTESLAAYRLVRRASRPSPFIESENRLAIELLQEACALDAKYADALAWLAWRQCWSARRGDPEARRVARELAERALVADPRSASAHFSLACVLSFEQRFRDAIHELRRAVALDPSHLFALQDLAWLLDVAGQLEESLEFAIRALQLQPNSANSCAHMASVLASFADYARAREWLRVALERYEDKAGRDRCDVQFAWLELLEADREAACKRAHALLERRTSVGWEAALGAIEVLLWLDESQRCEAALAELDRSAPFAVASHSPGLRPARVLMGYLHAQRVDAQMHSLFGEILERNAKRAETDREWVDSSIGNAAVYAVSGRADAALQWLDQAYRDGFRRYPYLALDPMFRDVRGDARFERIVSRMRNDVQRMYTSATRNRLFDAADRLLPVVRARTD